MSRAVAKHTPVFFGGEGGSEQSYGALLYEIIRCYRRFHIDAVDLGGGDPLTLVERAGRALQKRQANGFQYKIKAILLDTDLLGNDPDRDAKARSLAAKGGFRLIWQQTCHEAFLLRHMPGCAGRKPVSNQEAEKALAKAWPDYRKGMIKSDLQKRIDAAAIRRAAAVHPEFLAFLAVIEFPLDAS